LTIMERRLYLFNKDDNGIKEFAGLVK
jgi:hypothetical protein